MKDVAVPVALAGGEVETDVKKLSAVEQDLVARHLIMCREIKKVAFKMGQLVAPL